MQSITCCLPRDIMWRALVFTLLPCSMIVKGELEIYDKCPDEWCTCHAYYHPSDGPSTRVECKRGGMVEVPVDELDCDIHQLIIAPNPRSPNYLTIGPIFTQPVPFFNLRDLTISNSNVPTIGEYSFWGLVNLRTLNLTGNNITTLDGKNFRGLVNLTILALDHNNIGQMASETFRHMFSLTRLSLSHNKISSLAPRLFRMLGRLQLLDLSYNPLHDLSPEVFADIQNLIIFKCRKCYLRRINDQIYSLAPQIEELDLGENKFKFLMNDDFINLKKLKKLEFDGNQLSVLVDNIFKENTELQYLNVASNRIALWAPGTLNNLTNLNYLDISFNRFNKLPRGTFTPVLKSLTSIILNGNNLSINEITALLQILPELQDVGLSNLSLKEIPSNIFVKNVHLSSLDISRNLLARFPLDALKKTKYLKNLDVSYNKIESLNNQELRRLEAIAIIQLELNYWNCDLCSVGPMLSYMKNTVLNYSLRGLRCRTPLRLYGIQFAELTPELLDSCSLNIEAQLNIVFGMLLVLVAVLATGAIALCCTRRRDPTNYYTNENKSEGSHDHPEELLTNEQQESRSAPHTPNHETSVSS